MTSTTAPRRRLLPRTLAALWNDAAWPVLAGTATAVGLLGLGQTAGWPALGVVAASVAVIVALAVFAAFADDGVGPARAGWIGLTASVCVMVLLGLVLLLPAVGWACAAVVAITSPPATAWFATRLPHGRHSDSVDSVSQALEQVAVDAAFSELVAGIEQDAPGEGPDAG
jgi:hypothetical protein